MRRFFGLRGRNAGIAAVVAVGGLALLLGYLLNALDSRDRIATLPAAPEQAAKTRSAAAAPTEAQVAAGDFDGLFRTGIAAFRTGDAHGAARAFEAARKLRPHVPEVYVNLGFAYLEMGKWSEAVTLFDRATEMTSRLTNAYFGQAVAYEALGELDRASGVMKTYLHLAAEDDPFRRRAMAALWEWSAEAPQPAEPRVGSVAALTRGEAGAEDDATAPRAAAPSTLKEVPLITLDGAPASLSEQGSSVLVVNFWATWCPPCRAELPSLERLANGLDPARVRVVGINTDSDRAFTREYLEDLGLTFQNYWDSKAERTSSVIEVRAYPLTVVLNQRGEILARHVGARDWAADDIRAALTSFAEDPEDPDRGARLMEAVE